MVNNMVMVTVEGEPKPQGRPRFRIVRRKEDGKIFPMVYNPNDCDDWRNILLLSFKDAKLKYKDIINPLAGVAISITFFFNRPKSHYNSKGEVKLKAPDIKITKPDIDNLVKPVLDMLKNAGYFNDDGQIYALRAEKRYVDFFNERHGTRIVITYTSAYAKGNRENVKEGSPEEGVKG